MMKGKNRKRKGVALLILLEDSAQKCPRAINKKQLFGGVLKPLAMEEQLTSSEDTATINLRVVNMGEETE